MRNKLFVLVTTCLITAFFFVLPPVSQAMIVSRENAVVTKDEIVKEDLFISGERVVVLTDVDGDVNAAGGSVVERCNVTGDVLAVGGSIRISGRIGGDVQVAGGNINLQQATITGSLRTFGGSVNVDEQTSIGNGVVFATGEFNLDAPVTGGLTGGAGTLVINNKIGGDTQVAVGQFRLGPRANIAGDLVYRSQEEASFDKQATVAGQMRQLMPEKKPLRQASANVQFWANYGFHIWSYLSALMIGFILLRLMPKGAQNIAKKIRSQPLASLGWGFVTFFLTIPALVLLTMTIIGIPLAAMLFFLYLCEIFVSKIFVGIAAGEIMARRFKLEEKNKYIRFAAGLGGLYLLMIVPVLRFFVSVLVLLLGLGGIFQAKRKYLFGARK